MNSMYNSDENALQIKIIEKCEDINNERLILQKEYNYVMKNNILKT